MKNNTHAQYGRFSAILLFVILASLLTLTGVIVAQSGLPENPPEGGRGAIIFNDRCVTCHGPTGAGDGEMVDRLDVPPQAFVDPEYRKTAVPSTMFNMITDGDLATGMPPFGPNNANGPITEESRWNLVATVYSLATPPDAIERGTAVYEASCLECHGETGDGEQAANLADYAYWVDRSNEDVYNAIENGAIADHAYDLSDDERWDVVDYIRTFGYDYYDVIAAAQPLEEAVVYGTITNATTDEIVPSLGVQLRAFNRNFEQTLSITTTAGANGSYQFELTDVDPDWIYMADTEYGDLPFTGPAGQLSHAIPALEIPLTVYESTTDAASVRVGQQHNIIAFMADDRLAVDEIYTVVNDETAVFIGVDGDLDSGTVHYMLPVGAENVDFQRSFSAMQNSIPAMDDMVQIGDNEWADTLPVRPGASQSTLVVHYELPYDGGADLSRTVAYQTDHINLIMPDAGIELVSDAWTFVDSQDMGEMGTFVTNELLDTPAGTAVEIIIEGDPVSSAGGSMGGNGFAAPTAESSSSKNLLIGGLALLLVLGGAAYLIVSSRKSDDDEYEEDEDEEDTADNAIEIDTLVKRLAALDTAYEAGELEEAAYQAQRAALKEKLKAIW